MAVTRNGSDVNVTIRNSATNNRSKLKFGIKVDSSHRESQKAKVEFTISRDAVARKYPIMKC